jgi:pyroglutamyl-peptidase
MPARSKPSLLLTGFKPFPGVRENATEILVPKLAARLRRKHPTIEIRAAILATEWQAGPEKLERLIAEFEPRLRVHFGVSSRARGFVIETRASNACRMDADAAGALPFAAKLAPDEEKMRAVTLPAAAVVDHLKAAGFRARLSRDAGRYLCNAVLYHSLAAPGFAGFIHMPSEIGTRGATMSWDDAYDGALAAVEAAIEAVF